LAAGLLERASVVVLERTPVQLDDAIPERGAASVFVACGWIVNDDDVRHWYA